MNCPICRKEFMSKECPHSIYDIKITPKLVVYVGQDAGNFGEQVSKVLFVTSDNKEGREAFARFRKEKDLRYPCIHKFTCDDFFLPVQSEQTKKEGGE